MPAAHVTRRSISGRGDFPETESERKILAHCHVGVEPVVLEHHRYVAFAWRQRRDVALVNSDRP